MNAGEPGAQSSGCELAVKICGACGEKFLCEAPEAYCWCARTKLTSEILAELRAHYPDCLCPRCLNAAASRSVSDPQ